MFGYPAWSGTQERLSQYVTEMLRLGCNASLRDGPPARAFTPWSVRNGPTATGCTAADRDPEIRFPALHMMDHSHSTRTASSVPMNPTSNHHNSTHGSRISGTQERRRRALALAYERRKQFGGGAGSGSHASASLSRPGTPPSESETDAAMTEAPGDATEWLRRMPDTEMDFQPSFRGASHGGNARSSRPRYSQ